MNPVELLKRYGLNAYSTECDECGEQMPLDKWFVDALAKKTDEELEDSHFLQVVDGMCINMDGYYGGFTDMMAGFKTPTTSPYWALCHDCCVKLYEAFPNCAARSKPGHPYETPGEPCCKWGWTFRHDEDGKITGTEFGDGSFMPGE
ncbi:MAG: hypothetical protein DRI65_16620 [Chloroflexota bacterium]|nr:MAG: hypothetical protein DRI65_16620 [Chloroflexota bacterium]